MLPLQRHHIPRLLFAWLDGTINLYQHGPNPLMWIDPWGWVPHTATMTVYSETGDVRFTEHLKSGGTTDTSWPEQIASHTESKGIRDPQIQRGDRVVFTEATLPSCNGCKGNMNTAAANKNLNIEYHWNVDGKSQMWSTDAQKGKKSLKKRSAKSGKFTSFK